MVRNQRGLDELISEAALRPPIVQPRQTHSVDGVPITYKEICYFHLHDQKMLVRVNAYAFNENRFVDVHQEDCYGKKSIVRYGVCSPCAERRGMVLRRPSAGPA